MMLEFGDCVGICMHFQDPTDIASELAEIEIDKNPKKKKD